MLVLTGWLGLRHPGAGHGRGLAGGGTCAGCGGRAAVPDVDVAVHVGRGAVDGIVDDGGGGQGGGQHGAAPVGSVVHRAATRSMC